MNQQENDRRLKVVFDYLNEYANDVTVDTGGYIKYTRVLWADKTVNFNKVSLGSVVGSKLIVDYSYDVN